jgi:hypothetical protein
MHRRSPCSWVTRRELSALQREVEGTIMSQIESQQCRRPLEGEVLVVPAHGGWAIGASNREVCGDERQSDQKGGISYQVLAQL